MNSQAYNIISIVVAVITFSVILYVGLKLGVLRESIPNIQLKDRMFSLGRFQLWVWTLVICPIFVLYWGFSPSHSIELNSTAVILLGIPAGVTLGANVISSSQTSDMNETDHIRAEAAAENAKIATKSHTETVKAVVTDPTSKTVESLQGNTPPPTVLKMHQKSKSFYIDLISDDSGQLSLGRLQQLIFTLVFLVIYLTNFFSSNMTILPTFGTEVFALMGISSGTYLVAKGMNK